MTFHNSLQSRITRARKNAANMRLFGQNDPAKSNYWADKANEMDCIADTLEEQVLEKEFARTVPVAVKTSNVISFNDYRNRRAA